jgi:hypothetical protein
MARKDILVCGTLNLETTFPISGFPLEYEAVVYRSFELTSLPSGVGFNVARALAMLGNRVRLVSMVGSDFLGTALKQSMPRFGLWDEFILPILDETPQSVVVFDKTGRRMITTDLKGIGRKAYPHGLFKKALRGCRAGFSTSEASAICEKALLHPSLQLPGKPSGKNPTFVVSLDITQLDARKASEYRKKNLAILLRIVLT